MVSVVSSSRDVEVQPFPSLVSSSIATVKAGPVSGWMLGVVGMLGAVGRGKDWQTGKHTHTLRAFLYL